MRFRLVHATAALLFVPALLAGPPQDQLAQALANENRGVALRAQGRLAEARKVLESSLRQIQELTGESSPETAQAMSNLAATHWSSGDLLKAAELAARAEALYAARPETRAAERANNRQILASVYLAQRRYRDVADLLLPSIDSGDARTRAASYGNLAVASIGLGEMAQAEAYARRGVELAERDLPAEHPYRAVAINNLAQACRFSGNYTEAEKHYREALAIWEKSLGPMHPDVGKGLMNLAAFYHERGREAGAEQLYRRAAEILEHDPVLILVVRNELAEVFRAQLRYTESEKLARATLREMEGSLSGDDPRMLRAWTNWAKLLNETRRSAEAAVIMTRVARTTHGLQ